MTMNIPLIIFEKASCEANPRIAAKIPAPANSVIPIVL